MTIYTDMTKIPGPGDPETWGPCDGHPLDPRTPDWEEAQKEPEWDREPDEDIMERMREFWSDE